LPLTSVVKTIIIKEDETPMSVVNAMVRDL